MKRLCCSTTVGSTASALVASTTISSTVIPTLSTTSTRSHFWIPCKGKTEYRLESPLPFKTWPEIIAEHAANVEASKNKAPKNKKEELEHLPTPLKYERLSDMQRAANDMMCVTSDPVGFTFEMAYHYHRIWKANNPSKTWSNCGNGAYEIVKMQPNVS